MSKIYVKDSNISGRGIFAKRDIKKGEIVFIIKGKLVDFEVKNEDDAQCGPNWVGISENVWIDPSNGCKFLNHSCVPSAGVKGKVTVVALKNIKKDDEVTIDYSTVEGEKLWSMKCACGSNSCRKIIRSISFLPEKTYKHYLPCVPRYFQKVYNKVRK